MCASLFLCPLKCVVRVTSPASISFAPASLTPLRGLRLGPAHRPGCTLCVVKVRVCGVAGPDPRPGLAPGLRRAAPVEPLARSRARAPPLP